MATIVILGAGLGGVMLAYEMREKARDEDIVILVSDKPEFQFTPSNPWVAVGWRRPDQITISLPDLMAKYAIGFYSQGVQRLPHIRSSRYLAAHSNRDRWP